VQQERSPGDDVHDSLTTHDKSPDGIHVRALVMSSLEDRRQFIAAYFAELRLRLHGPRLRDVQPVSNSILAENGQGRNAGNRPYITWVRRRSATEVFSAAVGALGAELIVPR
jgi:hypothetical protein